MPHRVNAIDLFDVQLPARDVSMEEARSTGLIGLKTKPFGLTGSTNLLSIKPDDSSKNHSLGHTKADNEWWTPREETKLERPPKSIEQELDAESLDDQLATIENRFTEEEEIEEQLGKSTIEARRGSLTQHFMLLNNTINTEGTKNQDRGQVNYQTTRET